MQKNEITAKALKKNLETTNLFKISRKHDRSNLIPYKSDGKYNPFSLIDQIPDFNKGSVFADHSLWRMEPFKFWLLGKQLNLPEELGTDLDLSQAFTCIEITGEDIPLFLNRHLPVDLRENVFVFPASASSAIHHVSVKLLKFSIDKYYLFIPRGFALSIWEILLETSKQFGYEILDR